MRTDIYSPDERRLFEAWFNTQPLDSELERLLREQGVEGDCQFYSPLSAWVGEFAVAHVQSRLPNCGIVYADGRVELTRPSRPVKSRPLTGLSRFLFRINWADSGPGISWPADYRLTWLPGFERFVLTSSADSPEMFGYCDFALGWVLPEEDWRAAVRRMLVADWRAQFNNWNQAPWAYVWETGQVSEQEALAWRREAWEGHEEFAVPIDDDEDEEGLDENPAS